jgi:hypothetical protein
MNELRQNYTMTEQHEVHATQIPGDGAAAATAPAPKALFF